MASVRPQRLRCPLPMRVNPAMPPKDSSHAAESSGGFPFPALPEAGALEIVSVEVAVPEPGVMVAGEKVQLSDLEMPLHESAMGLLNDPECICAVTVNAPDLSEGMMTDAVDALKDNVRGGGGGAMVSAHEGL